MFTHKGITDDAGATWRGLSITPTALQFIGTRYYAVVGGSSIYSSPTGDTWTAETLPTVTGTVTLNDVFGE